MEGRQKRTYLHVFVFSLHKPGHVSLDVASTQSLPLVFPKGPQNRALTMITCEGCGRAFTSVGYGMHLSQTDDPRCSRIYQEYLAYEPYSSDSESDDEALPVPFEGDFFGTSQDYTEDDFGMALDGEDFAMQVDGQNESDWEHDEVEQEEEGTDNEDEDGFAEEYEVGWEPPVPNSNLDLESEERDEPLVREENSDDGHTREEEREDAEDSLHSHPTIVDFPSFQAGNPIQTGPTTDSTYALYGKSVPYSEENVYAPFASKREWEIARWAKLRGPGSTALSELLKIDGVSKRQAVSLHCTESLRRSLKILD